MQAQSAAAANSGVIRVSKLPVGAEASSQLCVCLLRWLRVVFICIRRTY
jgi:hypothetical protein